jgi:GNAT superfamily N-acetyltransferase
MTIPEGPLEIVFRRVQEVPSHWVPGVKWYVEAHRRPYHYPLGFAVVGDYPPETAGTLLLYVFVVDAHRGEGIARALAEACRERWPALRAEHWGDDPDERRLLHGLGFDPGLSIDEQFREYRDKGRRPPEGDLPEVDPDDDP